jgi:hypothetical protein
MFCSEKIGAWGVGESGLAPRLAYLVIFFSIRLSPNLLKGSLCGGIMYKLLSGVILIVLCVIFYRVQSEQINIVEETKNLVNLTGANSTGVNLDSAIFCNTTMPDERINNSGCEDLLSI